LSNLGSGPSIQQLEHALNFNPSKPRVVASSRSLGEQSNVVSTPHIAFSTDIDSTISMSPDVQVQQLELPCLLSHTNNLPRSPVGHSSTWKKRARNG